MNNLKKLRESKNLTTRELADKVNINQSTITNLENGKTSLSDHYIKILTDFYNVSSDYLLGLPTTISIGDGSFKPVQLIKYTINENAEIEWEVIGDMIAKVDNPDDYVAVEITDDQMEPTFIKGDIILVKKQTHAKNNQLVLANFKNTEVSIKRYKSIDDDHYLFNDNDKYDAFRITNDLDQVILGVVDSFTRKIN